LDAIRIIQEFVRDGNNDLVLTAIRRKLEVARTRWFEPLEPVVKLEIEVELGERHYDYRLQLDPTNRERMMVSEDLSLNGVRLLPIEGLKDRDRSTFRRMIPSEAKPFLIWMTENLHCIDIDPYSMGQPTPLKGRPRLARDLSNIGDWYARCKESGLYDESLGQLSASLKEVVEGFDSLQFQRRRSDYAELQINFNSPDGSVSFMFDELSEGQRCLIALHMILHLLIARGHTVFIDEPDNFLSLREIQPWLLAAEDAATESKGQLILISHHPEILNQWAQEYGLRFFREENGHVRTEKFKTDPDGVLHPSELIARGWENE
jgi:hypothetical protein